ncbi:MAG: UDP-3-O-acyl-N-acetylglucosamine deacetylase [Paludibacteraceae bacterium]|nr:UDP-3-O-acyl-N-acetylglucosamine deacetylase [Paludibacteraceae bacterium]
MKQHSLAQPFTLEGKGLHTGVFIHAQFKPAEADYGIRLCRTDLPDKPTHHAYADYVSATERGTVLEHGSWRISTVEHALSALYALGIDNCLIEVDGPEMPILDGSAMPFVRAIEQVGIVEQDAEVDVYVVREPIEYISEHGNRLLLLPGDKYEVEVQVCYPSRILKRQRAELRNLADYGREIASARTFCFVREIEPLLRLGLIKGGDLKNALVIYETPMSQEGLDYLTDKLGQPRLDATKLGYLSPIHFHNEPARHKLLDIIGDLSLVGCRLQARIIAEKPGHTFNTSCARQLRNKIYPRQI